MPIESLTDSYSSFRCLAVARLKLPAENGTYYHLVYLCAKLVASLIKFYSWIDTRDMVADGLTKGRVDRTMLARAMRGSFNLNRVAREYKEPATSSQHNRRRLRLCGHQMQR